MIRGGVIRLGVLVYGNDMGVSVMVGHTCGVGELSVGGLVGCSVQVVVGIGLHLIV